jgi:hypothetical protein
VVAPQAVGDQTPSASVTHGRNRLDAGARPRHRDSYAAALSRHNEPRRARARCPIAADAQTSRNSTTAETEDVRLPVDPGGDRGNRDA